MERILHINDYPVDAGGGAEVVLRHTIGLLRQQRLLVETFTGAQLADARPTALRYVDNAEARRALAAEALGGSRLADAESPGRANVGRVRAAYFAATFLR